jgi:opacity protein-like surface antigen
MPSPRRLAPARAALAATAPPPWALCAFAALCICAAHAPRAAASNDEPTSRAFRSAWQRPFGEHNAWITEFGGGGGALGGQMARVFDGGGAQAALNIGWRMGFVSIEAPLIVQWLDSAVADRLTMYAWGLRGRLHMPLGPYLRLLGGVGVYYTWISGCQELLGFSDDGTTTEYGEQCNPSTENARKLDRYTGYTIETSAGFALPLMSSWWRCRDCGESGSSMGSELLLAVEYRRLWHDLENDALARSMRGHIDALLVSLSFELIFADY